MKLFVTMDRVKTDAVKRNAMSELFVSSQIVHSLSERQFADCEYYRPKFDHTMNQCRLKHS